MHAIAITAFFLACTTATPPPETFTAGQTIGPWRVTRAEVRPYPPENGWVGEVDFAGEAVVRGAFEKHFDADYPNLCFFVDERDRGLLPRFSNDPRKPWFCFTNPDAIRGIAAGTQARIRIRDYRYIYHHSDVVNGATFVRKE